MASTNEVYKNINGIPSGAYIGQFERTTELDNRILERNFPSAPLEPNYDPRPISTKYSLMPALAGRKPNAEPKMNYEKYNVHNTFNPCNDGAPVNGFLNNVEHETYLRNQYFALQKGDKQNYVPKSSSELYNDYVFEKEGGEQPHPELFKKNNFINNRAGHSGLDGIGRDIFHNNTRTQLRTKY